MAEPPPRPAPGGHGERLLPPLAKRGHAPGRSRGAPRPREEGGGEGGGAEHARPRLAEREDGGKRGARGYDAGKRVKGRKRQVLVDSLGLIHGLPVQPADVQDRTGGKQALSSLGSRPRLRRVLADEGYSGGPMREHARGLGIEIEFVGGLKGSGFVLQPGRWVVERTLSWLVKCRRLRVDYDYLLQTTETWIYAAMIRLMLRRVTPAT